MLTIFSGSYIKKKKLVPNTFSYTECHFIVLKLILPSMWAPQVTRGGITGVTRGRNLGTKLQLHSLFLLFFSGSSIAQVLGLVPSIITIPTARSSQMRGTDLWFHTKEKLNIEKPSSSQENKFAAVLAFPSLSSLFLKITNHLPAMCTAIMN